MEERERGGCFLLKIHDGVFVQKERGLGGAQTTQELFCSYLDNGTAAACTPRLSLLSSYLSYNICIQKAANKAFLRELAVAPFLYLMPHQ